MKEITLKASAATTASETTDKIVVVNEDYNEKFTQAMFVVDVTAAATAAADTLDVYIDCSYDGTTWINEGHFTQILGNGGAKKEVMKFVDSSGLDNPNAVLSVAADAASAVTRRLGVWPVYRARSVIVDDGVDNASFTYSVMAYFS
jgi:hypothetical protein